MKKTEKTHWLSNPNKNYLGHWDLPNGDDLTLTIKLAAWEEVKNPILNTKEAKRVIRFTEGFKPMICNQTNAKSIMNVTKINFMEDAAGAKITLFVDTIIDKKTKERIDCIRVRPTVKLNPLFSPASKGWKPACDAVKAGTYTVDQIKKKYSLSINDEKTLTDLQPK